LPAGDRNRQLKRAKRPHSKFSDRKALDGPVMRPVTPLAVENGVGKLAAKVRQMPASGKRAWRTPRRLGASQSAALKDWRFESPRRSIAGSNRRTELRGNPKRGRRHSQRMRRRITGCGGRGRARGDSGSASRRLNGTMRGLTKLQDIQRAPGAERSLAFSLQGAKRALWPSPNISSEMNDPRG